MTAPARLIIPVWGEAYVGKLVAVTLPALLAPGNLPSLCNRFDVEVVIVTESRLFDFVRQSRAFGLIAGFCSEWLVSLDDLMLDSPIDYGAVLTHALFRGFADLGTAMTERYLIFLNADFIVSDGSLGRLGKLMAEGKRVIHAPSFRVELEVVLPQLQALVDRETGALRLNSRDMVRLALANKHRTVKARIVNQRLFHQSWMDQYYWYVDEDTLIGYQWPVALVAIKAERAVFSPVLVWDYGFVPEAAPTADRCFMSDSDDFFMIELQGRNAGDEMIRQGWISYDEIAKNLSMWTTKDQRECGKQLLKIHACDLPSSIDTVVEESGAYMGEIWRRLSSRPVDHVHHAYLSPWFDDASARVRSRQRNAGESEQSSLGRDPYPPSERLSRASKWTKAAVQTLETVYLATFGQPPEVGKFHPVWVDTSPLVRQAAVWRAAKTERVLWISSRDSMLNRLFGRRIEPSDVIDGRIGGRVTTDSPYGGCVCDLSLEELLDLNRLYVKIRPLMNSGAKVVIYVQKVGHMLDGADLILRRADFPSVDISELHFFGTPMTSMLGKLYGRLSQYIQVSAIGRGVLTGVLLIAFAPVVWLANVAASRRDTSLFSPTWTSLTIEFTIKRH